MFVNKKKEIARKLNNVIFKQYISLVLEYFFIYYELQIVQVCITRVKNMEFKPYYYSSNPQQIIDKFYILNHYATGT